MTTEQIRHLKPLWFGDELSLLGHLHLPRGTAYDIAVVICATPFGYENIAGHRGLRILADELAASGIASLRFDFPGTGDSDGIQSVDSWRQSVSSAVARLKRETGCRQLGVIGVGLGGTIAITCLDAGLDIDKLVVWEPHLSGREWLRKHRAYHRLAAGAEYASSSPSPSAAATEELSGFPMTAELAKGLTALDVTKYETGLWPESRSRPAALLVARDLEKTGGRHRDVLSIRGIAALGESWDGLDQMYVEPHLSIAPKPLFARMRSWLLEGVGERSSFVVGQQVDESTSTRIGANGMVEEIARYTEGDGGLLFSMETRPMGRQPDPTWLVMLTGRAVRHIGPNRIWVRMARELAERGYASVRLDGRSVGDSDGSGNGLMPNEEYYQEHIYDDIEQIMEVARVNGAQRFLMTGICSGATASYQIAWRRNDVAAILLLNPLQLRHDPEDDERAKIQLAKKVRFRTERLREPGFYLQILKGEYSFRKPLKVIRTRFAALFHRGKVMLDERSYVYRGFHDLAAKPVEIDVFVSNDDPICISFLERHFGIDFKGLPGDRIRVHRCPDADHTIRPLRAQEMFAGVLREALARISGRSV